MQQETRPSDSINATGTEPATPQAMLRLVEDFDWATTPLGPRRRMA